MEGDGDAWHDEPQAKTSYKKPHMKSLEEFDYPLAQPAVPAPTPPEITVVAVDMKHGVTLRAHDGTYHVLPFSGARLNYSTSQLPELDITIPLPYGTHISTEGT